MYTPPFAAQAQEKTDDKGRGKWKGTFEGAQESVVSELAVNMVMKATLISMLACLIPHIYVWGFSFLSKCPACCGACRVHMSFILCLYHRDLTYMSHIICQNQMPPNKVREPLHISTSHVAQESKRASSIDIMDR